MDVDCIDASNVEQTDDTEIEDERHPATSDPDHVSDIWDEFFERRLRLTYLFGAVEHTTCKAPEFVVTFPYVGWEEPLESFPADDKARSGSVDDFRLLEDVMDTGARRSALKDELSQAEELWLQAHDNVEAAVAQTTT